MEILTVVFMAIGLAMDALAVSVSNGISYGQTAIKRNAVWMGLYFGGFQFIMPMIGWFLGNSVRTYIEAIDHWVAFALLLYIGGSMVVGALRDKKTEDNAAGASPKLTHGKLILQAIATSIDALAVGITLAYVDVNIWISAGIIGAVAFAISIFGALAGGKLGLLFRKRAEIVGGLVLVAIGLKILIEHLLAG